MPLGPGVYDDLCTEVRVKAQAEGVILIIIGGNHGNGFSGQMSDELTVKMPHMLRAVASNIEKDLNDNF